MNDIVKDWFDDADPRAGLIEQLRQALMGESWVFEPALSHYRGPGLYLRRIYVPAGVTVVTRVHLQDHFTVALLGRCLVRDEQGNLAEVQAPEVFLTHAGTQRACHALTDVQWLTVHAVEPTADPTEMADRLTCKTMEEYARRLEDQRDYRAVLEENGLTEADARALSERTEDMDDLETPAEFLEIRRSNIEGQGIFAKQPIRSGESLGMARDGVYRCLLGRFTNHSATPNAVPSIPVERFPGVLVIAARDIAPGEEITVDYRAMRRCADQLDALLREAV